MYHLPSHTCAIHHHALHRRRGIVAGLPGGVATVVFGTTTPRPYGSRRTLAGSNCRPWAGSDGPATDSRKLPRLHAWYVTRASSDTYG